MSAGNCIWVVLFCNGLDEDDRRCGASAVPDQTMVPVRAGSVIADAVAAHAKARELGWSVSIPAGHGEFRDLCPECAERERKAAEEAEARP